MKFDVVVGNPPYQENDGGGGEDNAGGTAIYHKFIDLADAIADEQCLIVPTRWMSDNPRGIAPAWLKKQRSRTDIVKSVEYTDASSVFGKGVNIAGGVGYCHINKNHNGDAEIIIYDKNKVPKSRIGKLGIDGYVIRNMDTAGIIDKIRIVEGNDYVDIKSFKKLVGSTRTFSKSRGPGLTNYLESNWKDFSDIKTEHNYIRFFTNKSLYSVTGKAFVSEDDIAPGTLEDVKVFKCFISRSSGKYIQTPFIGGKNSCCSTTFVPMISEEIDDEIKADNMIKYTQTKLFNLLTSELKTTQHVSSSTFALVPLQDFTPQSDIDWSQSITDIDQQLYKKYNLTPEEIIYIEQTIKPMN